MRTKLKSTIIIITIIALALLFHNNSSALEYSTNADVSFTINPSITVSLSSSDLLIDELSPGTSSDSNSIVVNVSTNNVNGYHLSSTVGSLSNASTSLVHNTNNSNVFSSLSISDNLESLNTPGTWGYSYATSSSTDSETNTTTWNWSNYSGLPLYNDTTHTAILSERYTPANDNIGFKIAAYATNVQASGEYNNTINFTATAYPNPMTLSESYAYFNKQQTEGYYTMQDMEPGICATAEEGSELRVIDVRDYNDYSIAKINGNCWMTQNLRTTGTISAEHSNFTGDDFNISQGDLDSSINPDSYSSYSAARIHDSGNATTGVWYNYYAATAGTVSGSGNIAEATKDICPLNWRIPTRRSQSSITGTVYAGAFNARAGGVFTDGKRVYTQNGYSWSSTPNDKYGNQNRDVLSGISNLYLSDNFSRVSGAFIRCIANNE